MSESFSGRTPRARRESTVKKCTSCAKDLPDAAMHCVFCGAKQQPAAPPAGANAKTVMGWQASDLMKDMAAHGAQPAPGVAMPPPAAPPIGNMQTLAAPPPFSPPPIAENAPVVVDPFWEQLRLVAFGLTIVVMIGVILFLYLRDLSLIHI